jgi:hypothetical protein
MSRSEPDLDPSRTWAEDGQEPLITDIEKTLSGSEESSTRRLHVQILDMPFDGGRPSVIQLDTIFEGNDTRVVIEILNKLPLQKNRTARIYDYTR